MKTIISTVLFVIMFVTCSFSQVNLNVFEDFVVDKINEFRKSNGVSELIKSDSVKQVAAVECQFISNVGKSTPDPYFVDNMENVFGDQVHKSFNTNLVAHWNTKNFDSFKDIESRMAEGYVLQVADDKMTPILLKTFKPENTDYQEYIGVKSIMVDGVVYVSIILYMTNYN